MKRNVSSNVSETVVGGPSARALVAHQQRKDNRRLVSHWRSTRASGPNQPSTDYLLQNEFRLCQSISGCVWSALASDPTIDWQRIHFVLLVASVGRVVFSLSFGLGKVSKRQSREDDYQQPGLQGRPRTPRCLPFLLIHWSVKSFVEIS